MARPSNAPQLRPCALRQLERTVAKASPRRGDTIECACNRAFSTSERAEKEQIGAEAHTR